MSLFDTLVIQEYIQPPAQTSAAATRHDRRINKLIGTGRLHSHHHLPRG